MLIVFICVHSVYMCLYVLWCLHVFIVEDEEHYSNYYWWSDLVRPQCLKPAGAVNELTSPSVVNHRTIHSPWLLSSLLRYRRSPAHLPLGTMWGPIRASNWVRARGIQGENNCILLFLFLGQGLIDFLIRRQSTQIQPAVTPDAIQERQSERQSERQ